MNRRIEFSREVVFYPGSWWHGGQSNAPRDTSAVRRQFNACTHGPLYTRSLYYRFLITCRLHANCNLMRQTYDEELKSWTLVKCAIVARSRLGRGFGSPRDVSLVIEQVRHVGLPELHGAQADGVRTRGVWGITCVVVYFPGPIRGTWIVRHVINIGLRLEYILCTRLAMTGDMAYH